MLNWFYNRANERQAQIQMELEDKYRARKVERDCKVWQVAAILNLESFEEAEKLIEAGKRRGRARQRMRNAWNRKAQQQMCRDMQNSRALNSQWQYPPRSIPFAGGGGATGFLGR